MAVKHDGHDHVIAEIVEKIAFANYLPLLTRATADKKETTPGYMLSEIERLSYDYPHHCKQLAAYLSRRLEKPSAHVKIKVLKVMEHLIHTGHVNIRIALRKNDSSIKMATLYHGVPDPLTGTSLYETVRTNSKELLKLLFEAELIQADEEKTIQDVRPERPFLGALGSSNTSSGKYLGFGNSPRQKDESVTEKVLGYFDRLSTPSDQSSKIIRDAIASSVGKYEAVLVPEQHIQPPLLRSMPREPVTSIPKSGNPRAHVPGRAGGGWEDSDDEENVEKIQHPSLVSSDSLEKNEENLTPENSTERDLVCTFCGENKFPISWDELSNVFERCANLSGSEVLLAIADVLATAEGNAELRALMLVDGLLRTELLATPRAAAETNQLLSEKLTAISSNERAPALHRDKAFKILHILQRMVQIA